MERKQKRVCLWSAPRSCSTIFFRAINNAPGVLAMYEPFATAFSFGEERQTSSDSVPDTQKGHTFGDTTAMLNEPFSDYDTVFIKEMSFAVMGAPYSLDRLLPTGYTHTFLIRNPRKLFPSLYKLSLRPELVEWDICKPRLSSVKNLYDIYVHITKHVCEQTLIIDADDLLENPEEVLRAFCQYVGISFHPCMVDWNLADPSKFEAFQDSTIRLFDKAWVESATETTRFHKKPRSNSESDLSDLPQIIQDTIHESLPYYQEMYEKRLKFE